MVHISCSVRAIQEYCIFCIHGEVCARIERVVKFEILKISSIFRSNKTGFVRPGNIYVRVHINISICYVCGLITSRLRANLMSGINDLKSRSVKNSTSVNP